MVDAIESGNLWKRHFHWSVLLRWDVLGWILFAFPTAAAILLGFDQYWWANACFIATAIFVFAKIAHVAIISNDAWWQRMIFTFVLFGLVGVVIVEGVRGVNRWAAKHSDHASQEIQDGHKAQQLPEKTLGADSGAGASKSILPKAPPNKEWSMLGGGFEDANAGDLRIKLGGMSSRTSVSWLRKNGPTWPLKTTSEQSFVKVEVSKKGKLLFTCSSIFNLGTGTSKIEIVNNQFKTDLPFAQQNHSDRALEIADDKGNPVFQIMQEENKISINGVFAFDRLQDGRVEYYWAWDDHFAITADRPTDFSLAPIFKYPSWKYPGQYAEP